MFVLQNKNADPFEGEWTLSKITVPGEDHWAIDGIVLSARDRLYFIWSGWESDELRDQNLYIAPMDGPTRINGSRVRISSPQYAWETHTSPRVNEGPEVIKRGGTINLVYSGSGSWTDTYSLGLITAREDGDLLDPSTWKKRPLPIFKSGNGLFGPGHHSFTQSPDGKEDWIVYHTARWQGAGWTREIRAQPFGWNADSTPRLGAPVLPDRPIPIPSGEVQRMRYEAEEANRAGAASIIRSRTASGGMKVGHLDTTREYIEFDVTVPIPGDYNLSLRASNGMTESGSIRLEINREWLQELPVAHAGWDRWTNTFAVVKLNSGLNRIRITRAQGFVEIDSLDVFSDSR